MNYVALYRKYRPQTFDDVIGQDHIINTLRNQILHDKVNHAYLFTGTRGTGKTSTLRRLKDELPESEYMVLYISDSKLTPRSFYNYLLIQLGCKSEFLRNTTRDNLHKQIEIMRRMRSRKVV